jgi:hypothetical protein
MAQDLCLPAGFNRLLLRFRLGPVLREERLRQDAEREAIHAIRKSHAFSLTFTLKLPWS